MSSPILLIDAILVIVLVAALLLALSRHRHADAYLYFKRPLFGGIARRAIDKDVYHIGRQPGNELRLRDKTVSRKHAEIVRNRNGTHFIRDLGSANGLHVGRRLVESSMLSDGDVIAIGSVRMKFVCSAPARGIDGDTVMTEDFDPGRSAGKRRRSGRQPIKIVHAHLFSEVSGWVDAIVHDLSEDGALVETNHPFEPRTPVDLVFPVRTENMQRWLRIVGEVARVTDGKIGILFQEIDQATRHHLRTMLAHGSSVADVPVLRFAPLSGSGAGNHAAGH